MTQVRTDHTLGPPEDGGQPSGPTLARWTVERFEGFIARGMLEEGDAVELLDGLIVEKLPINPPHSYATDTLYHLLTRNLADVELALSQQNPVVLNGGSRPEPDLYLARGPRRRYLTLLPRADDLLWVCEVADSSLSTDQGLKHTLYAHAGIPEYWIVDINASRVACYTEPDTDGSYRVKRTFSAGEIIEHGVLGRAVVGELFGG